VPVAAVAPLVGGATVAVSCSEVPAEGVVVAGVTVTVGKLLLTVSCTPMDVDVE
jgi:hypothetical protein